MLLLPTNTVPICAEMIYVHLCLLAAIHCKFTFGKSCEGNHLPTLFIACRVLKNHMLIDRDKKDEIYYGVFDLLESV